MFERFTREARDVVEAAVGAAQTTGASTVESRHLLLALIERDTNAAGDLRSLGVEPRALAATLRTELRDGTLDAEALASVGIDLDAVRERADAVFGEGALERSRRSPKGHLPFARDAKKALELALRETIRLKSNRIDDRMLLLGLVRDTGSDAETAVRTALVAAGASVEALRATVERASAQAS